MNSLLFFIVCLAILSIIYFLRKDKKWKSPIKEIPVSWKEILKENVLFYRELNDENKKHFEYKVDEFLSNHKITGIEVEVEDLDRLLVAASAVIPIFHFPNWKYSNLFEVILYPNRFDDQFNTLGPERRIAGMVGSGYMEGKMILSKVALRHGFSNTTDKNNTAIHEFVHLIDKMDGATDGVPAILLKRPYVIPWLDLMKKKVDDIYKGKSDINPYAGKNRIEFFAVTSEYFFERPKLLAKKHPELYTILEQVFKN